MLYTIKYKKPGGFFWHKVKNIEGDNCLVVGENQGQDNPQAVPVRVFFLADKTRLEIPMACVIKFSKERHALVQANMEKEAGQAIRTKAESKPS